MSSLQKHIPLLIVILFVFSMPMGYKIVDNFMQQDRCLDSGGFWQKHLKKCNHDEKDFCIYKKWEWNNKTNSCDFQEKEF